MLPHIGFGHGLDARFLPVLDSLRATDERRITAGDQTGDETGIGAVGRRALRSIEHAQTTRGPRTHVEEATSIAERLDHAVNDHGNVVKSLGYAVENRAVFGMDEVQDLARTREIDPSRSRVPGLRAETLQELEEGAVVQDRTPGSTAPSGAVIA
jgi:hypothetical protein